MSNSNQTDAERFIEQSDLVTSVYGHWPTLENASVMSSVIDPHSTLFGEYGERTLILELHWWAWAPDYYPGGPRPYDSNDLHRRIKIAFQVEDLRLETFDCDDSLIDGLDVTIKGPRATLKCRGSYRLQCTIHDARVLSVTPCNEFGDPIPITKNAEP